eukprot:277620-Chlamydomonas_euryale.AAC.3
MLDAEAQDPGTCSRLAHQGTTSSAPAVYLVFARRAGIVVELEVAKPEGCECGAARRHTSGGRRGRGRAPTRHQARPATRPRRWVTVPPRACAATHSATPRHIWISVTQQSSNAPWASVLLRRRCVPCLGAARHGRAKCFLHLRRRPHCATSWRRAQWAGTGAASAPTPHEQQRRDGAAAAGGGGRACAGVPACVRASLRLPLPGVPNWRGVRRGRVHPCPDCRCRCRCRYRYRRRAPSRRAEARATRARARHRTPPSRPRLARRAVPLPAPERMPPPPQAG